MNEDKYRWKNGEPLEEEKMNRMAALAVEDAVYANAFELADADGNVALAITNEGHIKTKQFDSKVGTPDSSKKSYYNIIGSPRIYKTSLDTTGLSVFSTLDAMYKAYDELVDSYPLLFKRNSDIGYDASGTYPIRHYTLGILNPGISESVWSTSPNLWSDAAYPRRRIFVNGGIHGDERPCAYGCYLMIKEILESEEEWATFIKSNVVLEIVPAPNPWGFERNTANNSNGVNLNRTFLNDYEAENLALIGLMTKLKPLGLFAVIDFHNVGGAPGALVAKTSYAKAQYYAILATQLEGIVHDSFKEVAGEDKSVYYYMWSTTSEGQMHAYADANGLLGVSFEVNKFWNEKGSLLSKMIGINLLNAFIAYQDS